ncbi:MAG: TolC family protein [Bdellovibrionales bacterium]
MRGLILLMLGVSIPAFSGEIKEISEEFIKNLAPMSTPQLQKIELGFLNSKSQVEGLNDKYNYYFNSSASYGESSEEPLNQFVPVTENAKSLSLGISKATRYGVRVSTTYNTQQFSNNFLSDATTNTLNLQFEVDLLKDFLGSTSKMDFEAAQLNLEEAKLSKEIQKKQYINSLRKQYWDLVATEEAHKISESLLKSAELQLKEQTRKRKSGIGSAGDVARFQSLVSSRRNSLTQIESDRTMMIQNFQHQLPQLADAGVVLEKYNLDKTVKDFFTCTAIIEQQKMAPKDFTLYDERIAIKDKYLAKKLESTSNYSRPDLSLTTELGIVGNDLSFDAAQEELTGENNAGTYTVGLNFSMPIGSTNKNTQEVQVKALKAQVESEKVELQTKLSSLHSGIIRNLAHLKSILATTAKNQEFVTTVLEDSKKKYKQARISSKDLIDDEDAKLNNDLTLIQVQAQMIKIMLDYFSVFTETPCQLNKI